MAKETLMEVVARKWPADKVEQRTLSDLIPYVRNAKIHSEKQVSQIAASIREWGFTFPVLVDEENSIIAGHGRVLAAEKLKLDKVPVVVARGWSDAQKRSYRLADNKLTENAGWDQELLKLEVCELKDLDFNLDLMGFSKHELDKLQTDNAPEAQQLEVLPQFQVLIECANEAEQTALLESLSKDGLKCRALIS